MASRGIGAARDIRDLPALFDRGRFGLNAAVGVAYSLAVLLFEASEYLVLPLFGDARGGWSFAPYYASMMGLVVIEGAAFVVVVHWTRRAWLLVVAWALIAGVFEASFRTVAGLLSSLPPQPLPDALLVAAASADGALLVAGLALAVHSWGVCAEAFVVGAVGACLVHAVPLRFVVATLRPDLAWGWGQFMAWALVRGVVTGSLIYGGVAVHFSVPRSRRPSRPSPLR